MSLLGREGVAREVVSKVEGKQGMPYANLIPFWGYFGFGVYFFLLTLILFTNPVVVFYNFLALVRAKKSCRLPKAT